MKINYSTAKFVIVGAGETGRSIYNFLAYRGANVLRVIDTRATPPQWSEIEVIGGQLEYGNFFDADIIVISPGVSIYEPVLQRALSHGKEVIGDVELFAREIKTWNAKVIAITGSNGKTTVTSLTGFLGQQAGIKTLVAGNIGLPVLDALREIEQTHDYPQLIVLELSSFQLETLTSLQPVSATVLNISEDHLDRYRDLLEYAYVKANIFNNCQIQVLNLDDPLVQAMRRDDRQQLYFAASAAEYQLSHNGDKLLVEDQAIFTTENLQLVGKHNYLNVLASLALLNGAGYSLEHFIPYLAEFAGLEHRMQKVCEHNGVLYIEDSKGTNVGAVIAGVGGINRPIHLILGGDGKGQDFSPLRELVLTKCHSVALIGQDAEQLAEILTGIPNVKSYRTLELAVAACVKQAKSGDAVILSPACASWDMFKNYKHRAQVFIDAVHEYCN